MLIFTKKEKGHTTEAKELKLDLITYCIKLDHLYIITEAR